MRSSCTCSIRSSCIVACINDLDESWLEGSTTDKETVNVLLLDQITCVLICDWATVENSNWLLGLLWDVLSEPFSDLSVGILSNLWTGNLTCSNSPDWLVSNNNVAPVLNHLSDGVELSLIDFSSFATFSLSEELSNACKNNESLIKCELGLFSNFLIRLTIESSSLGVTGQSVEDTSILDHLNWKFTSVGTVSSKRKVLSGNLDIFVGQTSLDSLDVKSSWCNNNIDFWWVKYKLVEYFIWEWFSKGEVAIAFPVTADQEFSHWHV